MSQTFVPVDLDKLLDDFEEQDSAVTSAENRQAQLCNPPTFLTTSSCAQGVSSSPVSAVDAEQNCTSSCALEEQKEGSGFSSLSPNGGTQLAQRESFGVDEHCLNVLSGNHDASSQEQNHQECVEVLHGRDSCGLSTSDAGPSSSIINYRDRASDQNVDDLSLEKCVISDSLPKDDLGQDVEGRSFVENSSNLMVFAGEVSTNAEQLKMCDDASLLEKRMDHKYEDTAQNDGPSSKFLVNSHEADLAQQDTRTREVVADSEPIASLLDCAVSDSVQRNVETEASYKMVTTPNQGAVNTGTSAEDSSYEHFRPASEDCNYSALHFSRDHFSDFSISEDQEDVEDGNVAPIESGVESSCDDTPCSRDPIPVAQDVMTVASSPLPGDEGLGELFQLGYSPPQWIPDSEAPRCTNCQLKFTMVRRRHHCRACGKVFCASCCNLKFNLHYMEDKLARVCQTCANALLQRQAALNNQDAAMSNNDESPMYLYLSPDRGRGSDMQPSESSPVFADPDSGNPFYYDSMPEEPNSLPEPAGDGPVMATEEISEPPQFRQAVCSSSSSLSSVDVPVMSNVPLPPVLRRNAEGVKIDNEPNHQEILHLLKKKKETVSFLLNKNLIVRVKIVKLNCCVKRKCWCFSSEGMGAADQQDMVILLEYVPKESSIPQDVLSHFNTAFAYAKQGHRVTDLGYTIFGQPFLGSLRNAGFLYITPTFQCLENLLLPSGPYIFGILVQREEVSWVQLFPIRLILRLGAEYRYYPCPLWSIRDREPLFGEVGHTIMDLLADFKNFQYTLPRVVGMHVHLEDKRAIVQLPQNRYDEVVKVLNATDEYVMAFEATFSNVADSHLVCIQEGDGYKTQAINIEGHERKVTGVSFVVFNGALKTTNDVKAKVSIVEDGVMIQMVMQLSQDMRQAMREMRDFTISTGNANDSGAVQEVIIEWVTKSSSEDQTLSPIDGMALGTTTHIKINTHFDYSTPFIHRLRWSQLFFLDQIDQERPRNLSPQFKERTADIAKGCTIALRPHLSALAASGRRHIGLRVNLSSDTVGYTIGSQGTSLPDEMTSALDNELVPTINNAVNPSNDAPTAMEFVFNIIEII